MKPKPLMFKWARGLKHPYRSESHEAKAPLCSNLGSSLDGKAHGCVAHDIMLERIITKVVEENFVTIIDCQGFITKPQGSIRILSIQEAEQEATSGLQGKVFHVQTFGDYGKETLNMNSLNAYEYYILRAAHIELLWFSKIENITKINYLSM